MKSRVVAVVAFLLWVVAAGSPTLAQFETRASFGTVDGQAAYSLAVGDFNGDGLLDVAVVNQNAIPPGSVEILLGNGDGTFRYGAAYKVPNTFYASTASLRNNGVLDLVLGGAGTDAVYVMLGNGNGTFEVPVAYPTAAEPGRVELGNFTGSGNLDIVTLEITGTQGICDCVQVLPGNGDGTFGAPITTRVPYNVTGFAIASGDFNNDGKLDLAVGGQFGTASKLDVLLGNQDGTFTDGGYYLVGGQPFAIATGYFTGDKTKLDLAVSVGGAIDVLLGNGNGTFQQVVPYAVTPTATWLIADDLSGDGKIDLAASISGFPGLAGEYPPGVSVLTGNGDGTFQPAVFYQAGDHAGSDYVAAGDFNGDDRLDLVDVDTRDPEAVITLLNTGVVSFSPTTPLIFPNQAVGTTSTAQAVTLTNTGSTDLKIQSMTASAEFAVKSTCGALVAPSANCTITATFSPTEQGTVQGTITIVDSASSKPQVIELLGTGSSN